MNSLMPSPTGSAPGLPEHLEHALQPRLVRAVLDVRWSWPAHRGLRLEGVKVHRLFPRGRDGHVIKYQVTLVGDGGTTEMDLFGELVAGDPFVARQRVLEKLRKSRRKQIDRQDDSDALAAVPELGMLVRVPGYDERLPGLKLLHQPRQARRFIERRLGEEPDAGSLSFRLLNHRLGKRCILRLAWRRGGRPRSVVVRCLKEKDERHRRNQAHMTALRQRGFDGAIRVPAVVGLDDDLHLIAIEEVPGELLGHSRRWPLAEQAALAGAALGKLHATAAWLKERYGVEQELTMLADWVALATRLRPELAKALDLSHRRLVPALSACAGRPVRLAHRDYYNKQLLFDGHTTTLIDFDTLCLADPALDLGNYLAHRDLARLVGEPWDEGEEGAFLEAYARYSSLPPLPALEAWRLAARLRLACLYATHSGWEGIPERLLALDP